MYTMAEKGRQRDWCFTINNYSDEDICTVACMSTDAKYLVCGFEVGDQGVPHMQGYVYFDRKVSLKQLKEYNSRAHYERRRCSKLADAIEYCKKDGEFVEFGDKPSSHGGDRITYAMIENAIKNPDDNMLLVMRYRKAYEYAQQIKVIQSEVETKYFVIDHAGDPITEILTYFDWTEDDKKSLAVVTDLCQLEAYSRVLTDITKVIYMPEYHELVHDLWPRGVPISYKYGYEVRVIRPETFVIVTNQPKIYKLYKYIKY